MLELGMSGSVGATGGKLPVATRLRLLWRRKRESSLHHGLLSELRWPGVV